MPVRHFEESIKMITANFERQAKERYEAEQEAIKNGCFCKKHSHIYTGDHCDVCAKWEAIEAREKAEFNNPCQQMVDAGFPKRISRKNLELTDFHDFNDYDALLEYAKRPNGDIVLSGQAGSGKTSLACAIAKERIRRKRPASFCYLPDLFKLLKRSYSGESGTTESDILDRYSCSHLLIIDDMGTEHQTDWSRSHLDTIIDGRYRDMKPTIITTNLILDDIKKVSERIGSRLSESRWVIMQGDRRGK